MNDWVDIKINTNFAAIKEQSPLVRCLLCENCNTSSFERTLAENLPVNMSQEEKATIISEKVKKIIKWRKILDEKFKNRQEDKEFCLSSLGHLISAHYSGRAQSLDAVEWTLIRLANAISDKMPIIFTFCFGGYKCHTSPSHPEVDWAELFNINYFVSYLSPIIRKYPYGVEIEYESEEVSICYNNVPQHCTDKYTDSFNRLLEYYIVRAYEKYKLHLSLKLVLARDLYNVNELYKKIEEKKPNYYSLFSTLSDAEKNKWLQRAGSNFMWNGIKDYSGISEEEKLRIITDARITNEAFLEADYELRQAWFEHEYRVPFVGTWGIMPSAQPTGSWLHIKSTAASLVDFWIGTGCLEKGGNTGTNDYIKTIFSKTQLEDKADRISYLENDDEELKKISHNFNQIPVVPKETRA